MLFAQFDRAAITGGKQIVLAEMAAVPHRPNGVDHMRRLELVAAGDLGIAGLATVQRAAFGNKFGAGRAVDGAIDATAAQQRRIGRVDDRVNA